MYGISRKRLKKKGGKKEYKYKDHGYHKWKLVEVSVRPPRPASFLIHLKGSTSKKKAINTLR